MPKNGQVGSIYKSPGKDEKMILVGHYPSEPDRAIRELLLKKDVN
jgi:hypothetical protein